MKARTFIVILASLVRMASPGQPATNAAPASSSKPPMVMKALRVESKVFVQKLWNEAGTNEFNEQKILRSYLKRKGIYLSPPSTIFFNDMEGFVYVRSTQTNVARVTALIADLNPKR
jgi:hypothetical protein